MESLKTQQTESCKVEYTQGEKDLAARHKVEPRLVRLLDKIMEEKLARQSKQEPEEIETQEELQEPAELTRDERTQERIVKYYKSLEPRAKLAILALSEIQFLSGINFQSRIEKDKRLFDRIDNDLESTCIEKFHREPGDIESEDVWLCGIWQACRMVNQNI